MNKKEEIFTIGDKTNNGTISKFEIDSNGVRVFFEDKPKNYHVSLNNIKKVKQPLFTTEDGVDIFEGDKYYTVDSNFEIQSTFGGEDEVDNTWSSKEKAEEYILLNKPCLSYGDVQEYLKVKDCNKVLDLVQSKIKQSV